MPADLNTRLDTYLRTDDNGVVRMPILVKGKVISPPEIPIETLRAAAGKAGSGGGSFTFAGTRVICQPVFDRNTLKPTGEMQFMVFAAAQPGDLLETDTRSLAKGLFALPVTEVLDYIKALKQTLLANRAVIRNAASSANAVSLLDDRLIDLLFDQLPMLLDDEALGAGIDRDLAGQGVAGRAFLDGWVDVDGPTHAGFTAHMRAQIFADSGAIHAAHRPRLRAVPTRQLHITAGNSPMVPFLSFLRAISTKGAAIIKSPSENTAVAAILALAMEQVDADHPITRHTSLVYWKGGDPAMEDAMFASDAIDRLVVWGSPETVRSVRQRAGHAKTVFLNPRYGLSLIGREALADGPAQAAVLSASDSMIANQKACISSLVHYVEGTEAEALGYCKALQQALARWDQALPHVLPKSDLGRLRALRRGAFLNGTWFENGKPPYTTSAVIYMPAPFDLSLHPASRCIIVRRVDSLDDVIPYLNHSVSTVGVYPNERIIELRDSIAAAGVSNIFTLGDSERIYAGMPHDGMRILSELVNWTNA